MSTSGSRRSALTSAIVLRLHFMTTSYSAYLMSRCVPTSFESVIAAVNCLSLRLLFQNSLRQLSSAAQEAREVIHGLRRSPIGHAGLIETLSLLVAHIEEESGIKIVSELIHDPSLQPNIELTIYQIAREALVNAAKHSHADTIWLALSRHGAGVELTSARQWNRIRCDSTQDKAFRVGSDVRTRGSRWRLLAY